MGDLPESLHGVGAEVPVRILLIGDPVGELLGVQLLDGADDQVEGFGRRHIVVGRQHPQRAHVGAEELDLRCGQLPPVLAGLLGALEQRIIDVGDVLHIGDIEPQVAPGPLQQVERQVGERVTQMGGVVRGDATDIETGRTGLGPYRLQRTGFGVPHPDPIIDLRIGVAGQVRNASGRPGMHDPKFSGSTQSGRPPVHYAKSISCLR